MLDYLLHLDRPADVDCFLAFIQLLFHSIVWAKPIGLELSCRAAPAPARLKGVDIASGVIKSWQDVICITETEDQGGRNTRTEEPVEFGYFLPPAPAVFFWGMGVSHDPLGV